jgi:hypothetical protein
MLPLSPPRVVATSKIMPSRRLTRPRSRLIVEEADAVAITETRLAAIAARMGMPKPRVRRGTRNTPPPNPSSAPTKPVAAPANESCQSAGGRPTWAILTSFDKALWNLGLRRT